LTYVEGTTYLSILKNLFFVNEGKILGFVFFKVGMMIKPERKDVISKFPFPHKQKIDAILSWENKLHLDICPNIF
jgi:hypothetical protein